MTVTCSFIESIDDHHEKHFKRQSDIHFLLFAILSVALTGISIFISLQRISAVNLEGVKFYQTIREANRLLSIDQASLAVSLYASNKNHEAIKDLPHLMTSSQLNLATLSS